MGDWIKKVSSILGFEVEEVSDEKESKNTRKNGHSFGDKKNNIVSLHTSNNSKVILLKPKSYERVHEITDHLKNKTAVVVNLNEIDKSLAVRILDFISGTTYAIKGKIQKISPHIFLVTPSNYQVLDSEGKEELKIIDKIKGTDKLWDKPGN